ncbi:hypothetical protein [Cytobacillus horneckiae]|uniref:hypothetical protein n=1 Tax=Cytobacillus horneckiae TaxID=549687 RepID=UPI003D9A87CC
MNMLHTVDKLIHKENHGYSEAWPLAFSDGECQAASSLGVEVGTLLIQSWTEFSIVLYWTLPFLF